MSLHLMTYNLSKPFADDTPCKQRGLLPPLEPELMSVHDQLEGTPGRILLRQDLKPEPHF